MLDDLAKLNPGQRAAALTDGKNLLVSAAAGSGKTFTLTCRVLRLLLDPLRPVPPERLLIATFTVAAAAQMKNEISSALTRENTRAASLVRRTLDSADIGTIDSYLLKLVRRYGGKLGLPVNVNIDEDRSAALEQRLLNSLLEEKYSAADADFIALAELWSGKYNDNTLCDALLRLHRYRASLPDPERQMALALRHLEGENALDFWCRRQTQTYAPAADGLEKAIDEWLRLTEPDKAKNEKNEPGAGICDANSAESGYAKLYKYVKNDLIGRAPPTGAQALRYDCAAAKRCAAQLADMPDPALLSDCVMRTGRYAHTLFALSDEYERRLRERKAKTGIFGYADVARFALELLTVPDEAGGFVKSALAEELAKDYDEILIDEFQDTSPLQYAVFSAISNGRNLFCVGDVKQSIYRFRTADPGIFMDMESRYDRPEDPGQVLRINSNYRTDPAILACVNYIFRLLMTGGDSEIKYDGRHALTSGLPERFDPPGGFEVCLYEGKLDAKTEAQIAANKITELLGRSIYTKRGARAAEPRDFCVMVRSNALASLTAGVLEEYGLPVSLKDAENFFQTYEISALIAALRAVDNPLNDLYLLSALLSPVWNFSPDDAAALRRDRDRSFYTQLTERAAGSDSLAQRCKKLLENTELLRKYSALLPPSELIGCLADISGFYAVCAAGPDGQRKLDNISRFIRFAADCCAEGDTPAEFLKRIDRMIASGNAPKFGGSDQNGITVCTVHSAKGLEYPVCLLLDSAKPFGNRAPAPYCINREFGVGLRLPGLEDENANVPLRLTCENENKLQLAEEMRVFYVALTRAQHRLIATLPTAMLDEAAKRLREDGSAEPSALQKRNGGLWLATALLLHKDGQSLRESRELGELEPAADDSRFTVTAAEPRPPRPAQEQPDEADLELARLLSERFAYRYPAAALTATRKKYTVTELAKDTDDSRPALPVFIFGKGGTGYGTELHSYMQLCDFAAAKADSRAEAVRLTRLGKLNAGAQRLLDFSAVDKFFRGPLFAELAACDEIKREFDFICELPLGVLKPQTPAQFTAEPAVLQGCADCVGVKKEGLILVDYKSDRLTDPQQFIERYKLQLDLYAQCLEKIFNRPVIKKAIYSFRLGEQIIL